MFENNHVISLIFTFLPVLIYSIIVFVLKPNVIKWKVASLFFSMGLLSTIFVNAIHYAFPNWDAPISNDKIISLMITSFLKIGLLEEISKFLMFKLTGWYKNKKYHPSAIMFYVMSVSCGFAVSENILYAQIYGGDVLFIRSISSVIIHMICGLLMGYFLALKSINKKKIYAIIGIVIASLFHGIYDFNIFLNGNSGMNDSYIIILIGIIITYKMSTNLAKKSLILE